MLQWSIWLKVTECGNRSIILRQLELLCYLLLLLLSSCTPLGRGLGSTFHLHRTVSYYLMEKMPTLHTGRLSLSWLHYCVAGPQWLHLQGWALHRQQDWLENSNIDIHVALCWTSIVIRVHRLTMDWMKNAQPILHALCMHVIPGVVWYSWHHWGLQGIILKTNHAAAVFYLQGASFSQWVTWTDSVQTQIIGLAGKH